MRPSPTSFHVRGTILWGNCSVTWAAWFRHLFTFYVKSILTNFFSFMVDPCSNIDKLCDFTAKACMYIWTKFNEKVMKPAAYWNCFAQSAMVSSARPYKWIGKGASLTISWIHDLQSSSFNGTIAITVMVTVLFTNKTWSYPKFLRYQL